MKASADHALLSDRELLARVLGVREARRLYRGSLASLVSAAGNDSPGLAKLLAAREVVRRAMCEELTRGSALTTPLVVREYLQLSLRDRDHEVFAVLFLDAQNGLIASEEMFRGTLTQTSVYPREIVKAALRHNAACVILAHNHPSGQAEPSRADEHLTQTLKSALALVDVHVLDHVIVAGSKSVSFAERGLL